MSFNAQQHHDMPGRRSRPPLWLRLSIISLLVTLLLGGVYASYLLYTTVREFVARTDLLTLPAIGLPAINVQRAAAEEDPLQPVPQLPDMTPVADSGGLAYLPPPAAEASSDRINILLLGIDRRQGESWAHLTDTIIIVTVDPSQRTVGMLSIPRDLQIPIPGNGENRINTANRWGYSQDYPGGGPALLMRTIEVNFDIAIDYYIMIDFAAFVEIVDTLNGIDINVPATLHDTQYPDPKPGDPFAFKTVHFEPGWQHMDGQRALEYARSRMSTTDFDRAKRQQLILIAIRDKALGLNLLPKLPSLARTMADNMQTDMTIEEIVDLAKLVPQVDASNIKQVVIQKPMVYGYKTEEGAAVQLPKWDLIRPVVAELFSAPVVVQPTPTPAPPTPTPTLAPIQIEELQELAQEGARIAIQNGTSQANYAAQVAAMLMQKGYQVVEFGDADRLDYANTVVVDYTDKRYTLERLVELFQVTPENVRQSPNPHSRVDIRVIVGQDFLLSQP